MNTLFLLMAQYGATAVVPLDVVCRDYFPHLVPAKLAEKITKGEIPLPMTRIETSQKTAKGFHIQHLADYIDARAAAAKKEWTQINSH